MHELGRNKHLKNMKDIKMKLKRNSNYKCMVYLINY